MGKIVNKQELAEILGRSERALTEWQKQGMPVEKTGKRGQSNEYDTEKVIAWWLAKELPDAKVKGTLEQEEQRWTKARATKAEMEVEAIKATLLPADEVKATWCDQIVRMRAKLLALPARAASACALRPAREIKAALTDLIHEALNELVDDSEPECPQDAPGGDESPAAAGKTNTKRMVRKTQGIKRKGQRRAGKVAK